MTLAAVTQTEWARIVARTLLDVGVRQLFASPGSRSTPYLAASLSAGLRVIDVVDERAAAFAALGFARAGGEPAAVLCTSGTAPGHWMPAVLEASLAGIPLVLLSADRPTELSLCGAAQTVDQLRLFGPHVRFFADAGNPEAHEGALAGLRRLVAQAVSQSRGPLPGPVHLNLRARKPLEPRDAQTDDEMRVRRHADALLARPVASPRAGLASDVTELAAVAELLSSSERLLVVAGPLPIGVDASAIHALVRRAGGVLAAELTSQLRFVSGAHRLDSLDAWLGAGLWSSPREARVVEAPDLVVELGGPPTSGAYERWVARTQPRRIVLGARAYADPHASAERVLLGDLSEQARILLERVPVRVGGTAFAERLEELDREAETLAAAETLPFGEPSVARTAARLVPDGGRLVVGNSLPIRMLDRYASRSIRGGGIEVLHQRGANGIDGLVAQSLGATLASPRPTVALLGDLTLLHDVGSLALARRAEVPLVLVVVDNGGGRIFEALPVAGAAPWMMAHMVTEERVDHAALASAFGLAYARAESSGALEQALSSALERKGATLIIATVPPHGAVAREASLAARVAAALSAHGGPS